ncbi:MAG: hypothetical protein ACLR0P_09265 [Oscillospiraceae bacterium]
MALVKISKGADIRHEYTDGVSRVPVLEGAYKDAAVERISLQPGAELSPALYSKTEHNQVFLITAGKGYIATPAACSTSRRSLCLCPTLTRSSSPSTVRPMPRSAWRSSISSPSSTTTTRPA